MSNKNITLECRRRFTRSGEDVARRLSQIAGWVILVRHSPSGTYFLVRASEEARSLETLRKSYPEAALDVLERSGELLLVRVVRSGSVVSDQEDPPPSLRSISFPSSTPPRNRPRGGAAEPGES